MSIRLHRCVRLTLIGFILLMYALYGLYRLWRALRMDEQLLRRFPHPRGEEVPVAGEIADLRTVNILSRSRPSGSCGSCGWICPAGVKIRGKRFRMSCRGSWWSAAPATAKPRPSLNTGLQFSLAEQMEQTSRILTVPRGTLHCDWWFTNEAVLIDTADATPATMTAEK